ncbi:MAG: sulfite exporter TauE/SafE family protein [Pirellulaceae bacterium]
MDTSLALLAAVAGVFFASTLTRSTFGFGDALVAMPLLSIVIGFDAARPLGALVSVYTAVLIVARDWRQIDVRSAWRLVLAGLVGLLIGEFALMLVDARWAQLALAGCLFAFALYSVVRPTLAHHIADGWAWLAGACAGVLGIAFNMHGPPLVIFGTLRGWPAKTFRATLQGYFLPVGTIVMLRHALGGAYQGSLLWMCLVALPGVTLAVPLGRALNARLGGPRFARLVYVLLMAIAVLLFTTTLRNWRQDAPAESAAQRATAASHCS